MEKQYKLTDRVSKDSLKSPTFKKWLKRVLCFVCILSLALQLAMCVAPMSASAEETSELLGTWVFNTQFVPVTMSYSNSQLSMSVTLGNGLNFDYTTIFSGYGIRFSNYNGSQSVVLYTNSSSSTTDLNGQYINVNSGSQRYDKFNDAYLPYRTVTVNSVSLLNDAQVTAVLSYFQANAVKVVEQVYDFTGEYRLFNEQLTGLSFAQAGTVTQTYQFDYRIWNGYSADYFTIQATGSQVNIRYAFTDDGSGGVTTVYRQLLRDGNIVGTWLVPRARLIYFESNPDDTTLQQWLLDNTTLIDESMLLTVYDFGYNNGFNDGWTDNLIGDTLNAPIQALNNITLLQVGNTVITLGGVIFTMIVLCILIVFLKKFAGG